MLSMTSSQNGLSFLEGVLASLVAAILFALLIYFAYVISSSRLRRDRLFARDLWWLPRWNTWRFVVRNIQGKGNLCQIEYRSWLREILPAARGSSVKSFRDTELVPLGKRIILPREQDLPILCFRLEERDDTLVLVHTDKFGDELGRYIMAGPNMWSLKAEYSLETHGSMGLPHRVQRLLTIPEKAPGRKGTVEVFKRLQLLQGPSECWVPLVFTGAEEISVRLPE